MAGDDLTPERIEGLVREAERGHSPDQLRALARGLETLLPHGFPEPFATELDQSIDAGLGGDPAAARRAAELFELFERYGAARWWWRTAAEMGDPDAIDYVREILEGA